MRKKRLKIGIIGCGAIGSGIAKSVRQELKGLCELVAIYDLDSEKSLTLAKSFRSSQLFKSTVNQVISASDLIVEAVSSPEIEKLVLSILKAKKDLLMMSVGQAYLSSKILKTAKNGQNNLLLPSGAIAGIDAIKSASLRDIKSVSLVTRKPLKGFKNDPYLKSKKIDISKIKSEKVIFKGTVNQAIKAFPRNINVAAALALACGDSKKLTVKIITSPKYRRNSHEITVSGSFGKLTTMTESVVSPDNPKTSYLAVLSGIQTLKNHCETIKIGT